MKYLLDTHLLPWAAATPGRLWVAARDLIENAESDLTFSVASPWEIAIKRSLGRDYFRVHPAVLLTGDPRIGRYPGPIKLV